ncbi:MAG: CCA tRNA nucleotidyltransferase [Lachnospirales bacterium]
MKIPKDVDYILNKLEDNNYEAYVVGGCVRDFLMHKEAADWDITTSALPCEIKKVFNHTFDTGIDHGTITVVLNKINYEVTTFRIDGEYSDNRRPNSVEFTRDIVKDLERRDFTINAIAYNKKIGYVDPFHGMEDIKKGIIRGVGNAALRFQEDALRMIRAIRFAGKTGFVIEEKTYVAIKENNYLFKNISAERVRIEFEKLLLSQYSNKMELLIDCELMKYFNEEFHEHLKNNWKVYTLENHIQGFSLLLREYNKVKELLQDFKYDNKTIKSVLKVVKALHITTSNNGFDNRKFICEFLDDIEDVIKTKELLGWDISYLNKFYLEALEKKYPLKIKDLDINGNILMEKGYKGKEVGEILNNMLEFVLEYPEKNNKNELLDTL